jgi:hypothetical protein
LVLLGVHGLRANRRASNLAVAQVVASLNDAVDEQFDGRDDPGSLGTDEDVKRSGVADTEGADSVPAHTLVDQQATP